MNRRTNLVPCFVGRVRDLQVLGDHVAAHRWTAIVGPPGVGKTRIAQELLSRGVPELAHGAIWHVELADVSTIEVAWRTIARVAVADELTAGATIEQLGAALATRGATTLLLDDIDRIEPGFGAQVEMLLAAAPALRVITTSLRRPIAIAEDPSFELGPMSSDDAFALFVERATASRRDFDVAVHRDAVTSLVEALGGLPLAIELAAARMRVASPEQLLSGASWLLHDRGADRLQSRLEAVVLGAGGALRLALAQLTVFRGGFELADAAAVLDVSDLRDAPRVESIIASLRDASLLTSFEAPERPHVLRFDMLAVIREYAEAMLGADALRAVRRRHARRVLATIGEVVAALGHDDAAVHRLALERRNVLAIIRDGDARDGLHAAIVCAEAYGTTGPFDELAELLAHALARADEREMPTSCAEAWWWRGEALRQAGTLSTAAECFARVRPLAIAAGDNRLLARCAYADAALRFANSDHEAAEALYVTARDALEDAAELELATRAACDLGTIALARRDPEAAQKHFERALATSQARGDRRGEGRAWMGLGALAAQRDRLADAQRSFERALVIHLQVGDRRSELMARAYLAMNLHLRGEYDTARAAYLEALELGRRIGHRLFQAITLGCFGMLAHQAGELVDAQAMHEDALACFRRLGNRTYEILGLGRLAAVRADRGDLAGAEHALANANDLAVGNDRVTASLAIFAAHVELAGGGGVAAATSRLEATVADTVELRIEAAVLRARLATLAATGPSLEVDRRGRWFKRSDGERVGLERRGSASRLLATLVEQRSSAPGETVSVEELFEYGWPSQRVADEVAAQRVYTTLWTLRRLGLHDVIVRVAEGYCLDPRIPITCY